MVIKFNPALPAATQPAPALHKTPTALMMAPVGLTPLAPPSAGPVPVVRSDGNPAAERRQAFFAQRQQELLAQLPQAGLRQGSLLAPAQRAACESVLKLVVAQSVARSTP